MNYASIQYAEWWQVGHGNVIRCLHEAMSALHAVKPADNLTHAVWKKNSISTVKTVFSLSSTITAGIRYEADLTKLNRFYSCDTVSECDRGRLFSDPTKVIDAVSLL